MKTNMEKRYVYRKKSNIYILSKNIPHCCFAIMLRLEGARVPFYDNLVAHTTTQKKTYLFIQRTKHIIVVGTIPLFFETPQKSDQRNIHKYNLANSDWHPFE
jgi:hypothetical protein